MRRDIGVAYAVLALGLGFALKSLSLAHFATAASASYLGGHAALHCIMELSNGNAENARAEAAGVDLPAILGTIIVFRFKRLKRASGRLE